MSKCFMIQRFDGGKFDKRYEDVFSKAIELAGLEPYRVDQDPGVRIPIQDIESGIENSAICLAEITTNNPNVWFELGYAFAARREVLLLCSDERTERYPFDIQHRLILEYQTESSQDYEKLKTQITTRLRALLKRSETIAHVVQTTAPVEGLLHYEIATLVATAQQLTAPTVVLQRRLVMVYTSHTRASLRF